MTWGFMKKKPLWRWFLIETHSHILRLEVVHLVSFRGPLHKMASVFKPKHGPPISILSEEFGCLRYFAHHKELGF